ncbi:MAG: polysaccharide biosynthesis protein [Pseudomonadota bacterium]
MFKNKTVLVTGGTGSFGNVVARHFLNSTDIKEIRIFSRDEKKQEDMRLDLNSTRVKYHIGDVRDYSSIENALRGVDYVFSAAALKQVPSCEFYPMEAVKTNILGTENVLNACIASSVKNVVVLSTDKAVYPINAMGISKAMMEKVSVAKGRAVDPKVITISATRYGNVLASRGSVVPLFIKQIKENKSITITDPEMTRFLMTLDQAMHLVFFAFKNAEGGDIFVQKSPASTIHDLAIAVCEIFNSKNEIKIIGTRHGEKKHETLLSREERLRSVDLGDYYRVAPDDRDLNYSLYYSDGDRRVTEQEDYNSSNTRRLNVKEIKEILLQLPLVQEELRK